MSAASFTPPRRLILAAPVGIYSTLTLAPENGWTEAAIIGAVLFALVLFGPMLIRAAVKAAAVRSATKARKTEKKEGVKK